LGCTDLEKRKAEFVANTLVLLEDDKLDIFPEFSIVVWGWGLKIIF